MRTAKLRKKLKEAGIDAALITNEANQSWLCGFDFTDGALLVCGESAYLLTDFRYIEAASSKADSAFKVLEGKQDTLPQLLAENRIKKLGFEDNTLPYAEAKLKMERLSPVSLVPLGGIIEDLREYKDDEEIAQIKRAQEITDKAFEHIINIITPDMTETDIAVELEFFMRKNGAQGKSFDIIAVSGASSSLPHGVPRPVKLEKGFLTLDFGCICGGYCSDMTRTVCIGKADGEMKKLYNTVLDAQLAAIDGIGEGKSCAAIDKIARDIIYAAYGEKCFGHGLGHGVGRYIHEEPRLSQKAGNKTLGIGHVVTVEPGIYLEGKYGCRIEDMVIITPSGALDITKSPKQLIEL